MVNPIKHLIKNKRTKALFGLLFGIFLWSFLFSCQSSSKGYVTSFERFVMRVEQNASKYSNEEWDRNDANLHEMIDRYSVEKSKLSPDQKRKIGELTVRYYKARIKSFGFGVIGEIGDWLDFIQGFADEIMEEIENYQMQ